MSPPNDARPDTLPPEPEHRRGIAPDVAQQILEAQQRPETGGTKSMRQATSLLSILISVIALASVIWNAATTQTQMRSDIDAQGKAFAAHMEDVSHRRDENEARLRALEAGAAANQTNMAVLTTRFDTVNQALGEIKNAISQLQDRHH